MGLVVDEQLVHLRPEDPTAHYNLACRYALLKQRDKAIKTLRRAVELGYRDFDFMQEDHDLDSIRKDPRFRKLVKEMFPESKLEAIPVDDELYSEKLNGVAIRTVRRREKAEGDGPDAGFRDLPPALEGVKIDGRWAIIYSKYDIGCALEGHKSTDCLGHTRESALRLGEAAILYALKR